MCYRNMGFDFFNGFFFNFMSYGLKLKTSLKTLKPHKKLTIKLIINEILTTLVRNQVNYEFPRIVNPLSFDHSSFR